MQCIAEKEIKEFPKILFHLSAGMGNIALTNGYTVYILILKVYPLYILL